jgi:hypothetical protein
MIFERLFSRPILKHYILKLAGLFLGFMAVVLFFAGVLGPCAQIERGLLMLIAVFIAITAYRTLKFNIPA